jgi:hypothetical protein
MTITVKGMASDYVTIFTSNGVDISFRTHCWLYERHKLIYIDDDEIEAIQAWLMNN